MARKTTIFAIILGIWLGIWGLPIGVNAAGFSLLNPVLKTGETLIIQFKTQPTRVLFREKPILIFPYRSEWRALIPLPLGTKTGLYGITADFTDGTRTKKNIYIQTKKQVVIVLPPPPQLGLTDKQIVQNLAPANQTMRDAVVPVSGTTQFQSPFGYPLTSYRAISSPFGEIRQTGSEKITHLGVDFAAPKGQTVVAINSGTVVRAYVDPIYGNSVIVDHGQGIYSLYLHLDTMQVKNGAIVKKGTPIGTLGNSGLSSAPHLHLSIKIDGASVDPLQFISKFQ